MDSSYFERLEAAFNCVQDAGSEVERQQIILALSNTDPDLVEELSTLVTLKNERVYNKNRASDKKLFDLLLTTLGEGSRRDTASCLLDFLSEASGTSSGDAIASIRGFAFKSLIATGPTGFVFEGLDETLGRKVAIKVLAPSIADDRTARDRFLSEAILASSIEHQNVIDVYHVSTEQKSKIVFFVMEWYEGESLQSWLNCNRICRDSLPYRLSLFREIARGLEAIHKAGIIHRDLKPGNVMINSGVGTLKILDFGIAINTVSGNQTIPPAGTPLYMAPEQMAGELLTPKTDLFALAEIACVLFAGYHPFEAQNLNDLQQKLLVGPDVLRTDATISDSLKSVLLKGLSLEPSGRFQEASTFKMAVEDAMSRNGTNANGDAVSLNLSNLDKPAQQDKRLFPISKKVISHPLSWGVLTLVLTGLAYMFWGWASADLVISPPSVEFAKKQKGSWKDGENFENYEGMGFVKVSLGDVSRDQKDQFAEEHPELSKNLGWANFAAKEQWLIQKDLVSTELFQAVMGLENSENARGNPVTNIDFYDVEEFCKKLSENCPNGLLYKPVSKNQLCFAMYGKRHFIDGVPIELLNRNFEQASKGDAQKNPSPIGLPLINGLFEKHWEWTEGYTIKSANLNGVVDYSERIETPYERSYQIMGGGQTDIFVHRSNMAFGMNDFYHESDNLRFALEEDGQTSYLCPIDCDRPAWVSYRYRFPSGVRSASIGNGISLHRESGRGGIKVRFRRPDSPANLDSCEWNEVYDAADFNSQPFSIDAEKPWRFDVSELLAGAIEVEIKYWLQSDQEPTYYEQLARTLDSWSLSKRTMEFSVTSEARLESMRQFSTVPASYRHPSLSFRVMANVNDSNSN